MNLATKLSDYVELETFNRKNKKTRVQKVKIQYDQMPKYCHTSNLKGHEEVECWILHPELRLPREDEKQKGELNKKEYQDSTYVQRRYINSKVVFTK